MIKPISPITSTRMTKDEAERLNGLLSDLNPGDARTIIIPAQKHQSVVNGIYGHGRKNNCEMSYQTRQKGEVVTSLRIRKD